MYVYFEGSSHELKLGPLVDYIFDYIFCARFCETIFLPNRKAESSELDKQTPVVINSQMLK